jgi:hypothetical protein
MAGFCSVRARGLEPLKPKQMIYSHPELPLSDAPMVVGVGVEPSI